MPDPQNETSFQIDWWNRVSLRMGIGVLLVTAAALASVGWFVNRQGAESFREQHITHAHDIARVVADRLADRMMAGGAAATWTSVAEEAARFLETADVARIMLVSNKGQVKVSTDPAYNGQTLAIDTRDCPECGREQIGNTTAMQTVASDGGKWLRLIEPVPAKPGCFACHPQDKTAEGQALRGYILLDFDLAGLERAARQLRYVVLVVGAVSGLLLLALVSWLFRHSVMRALDTIVGTAGRIAGGDLSARAPVESRDELGQLANHFNRMAERIEDEVGRLEASNLESSMLYSLVVEVSRHNEITEVASTVIKVLMQKLAPQQIAFFAKTADGRWVCATHSDNGLVSGSGTLESALISPAGDLAGILARFQDGLVTRALRDMKLQLLDEGTGFQFAMPLVSASGLLGLLACRPGALKVKLEPEMIENLGVHLALALENALHYTGAITDALTLLRNKSYGLSRLDEAVYAAQRQQQGLALVMLDIDHFKRINDTYGHPVGDEVLKEVAQRIRACSRKADLAVRFGGEEFLVVLPQTKADSLAGIGERLRAAVAASPVAADGGKHSIQVRVSVGLAAFRVGLDKADTLLARADQALYRAKNAGRNRVEIDE